MNVKFRQGTIRDGGPMLMNEGENVHRVLEVPVIRLRKMVGMNDITDETREETESQDHHTDKVTSLINTPDGTR
jgi:hypothetical protein